jgi:hypothetical protein
MQRLILKSTRRRKQEMTKANSDFEYDVFVSYSHQDRDSEWVRGWLVPRLEEAGLSVWMDVRELLPGSPFADQLEQAITRSRAILIVLTPGFLKSGWATLENMLVRRLDPAARQRRVIPLMLEPCELPLRIRMMTYADFTRPDQTDFQLSRLLAGIGIEEAPSLSIPSAKSTIQPADYDLRAIRNLLTVALDDEELTSLCFDHFRRVYEEFSTGMSKRQKVQRLIEYCERHLELDRLLHIVRQQNPSQYSVFEGQLKVS